jgi:membrane protease YdiL (CAAX protease family)
LVIAGVLVGEELTERLLLKILRRGFPSFFEKKAFWRRGFAGKFWMVFFSLVVMGLLGFGEQFGLTLQNLNESLRLILLLGLPFAVLLSLGVFIFVKKGRNGKSQMPLTDWMKNPSDRMGHLVYCFTINGIGEEMFYRGLIQGYLSVNWIDFVSVGSFPLMYSTILASVIFILVHLGNVVTKDETMREYIFMLPFRAMSAFIFGITFQLTGSLLAPIVEHNLSNGFLSLAGIQAVKDRS